MTATNTIAETTTATGVRIQVCSDTGTDHRYYLHGLVDAIEGRDGSPVRRTIAMMCDIDMVLSEAEGITSFYAAPAGNGTAEDAVVLSTEGAHDVDVTLDDLAEVVNARLRAAR